MKVLIALAISLLSTATFAAEPVKTVACYIHNYNDSKVVKKPYEFEFDTTYWISAWTVKTIRGEIEIHTSVKNMKTGTTTIAGSYQTIIEANQRDRVQVDCLLE